MRYRVGMPLWKVVAKLGFKLRLRVVTKYDPDATYYYVAFSDLRGLNTDSESLDSLRANIKECVLLLLDDYVKDISKVSISMVAPILGNKTISLNHKLEKRNSSQEWGRFFIAFLSIRKSTFLHKWHYKRKK